MCHLNKEFFYANIFGTKMFRKRSCCWLDISAFCANFFCGNGFMRTGSHRITPGISCFNLPLNKQICIVKIQCEITNTLVNLIRKGTTSPACTIEFNHTLNKYTHLKVNNSFIWGSFLFSSLHIFKDPSLASNELPPSQPATSCR